MSKQSTKHPNEKLPGGHLLASLPFPVDMLPHPRPKELASLASNTLKILPRTHSHTDTICVVFSRERARESTEPTRERKKSERPHCAHPGGESPSRRTSAAGARVDSSHVTVDAPPTLPPSTTPSTQLRRRRHRRRLGSSIANIITTIITTTTTTSAIGAAGPPRLKCFAAAAAVLPTLRSSSRGTPRARRPNPTTIHPRPATKVSLLGGKSSGRKSCFFFSAGRFDETDVGDLMWRVGRDGFWWFEICSIVLKTI